MFFQFFLKHLIRDTFLRSNPNRFLNYAICNSNISLKIFVCAIRILRLEVFFMAKLMLLNGHNVNVFDILMLF